MEVVKEGYKMTEVGRIPRDWEVKRLGLCLAEQPKYGIGAAAVDYNFNLPTYLRITDINEEGVIVESGLKSVDNIDASNYYLEEGDIVLARTGASVGKSYYYNSENRNFVYAGFLIKVRSNPEILLPSYLNAYLKTSSYWKWVNVMSMRSGQPGINSTEYALLQIPLPPTLTEQRAIATALSDVDALISGLDELIEKKKAVKQGAMQELLTGKTRLPGFEQEAGYIMTEVGMVPRDWEVKRLGLCLAEQPKYGIGAAAVDYNFNLPTYLRITDIDEEGVIVESGLKSVDNIDASNYYLEEGDIVLARTGASVGKSYYYNSENRNFVYAGFLIKVRSNPEILLPSYLNAYIKTSRYWKWVNVMSMRSGQPGINSTEYSLLQIPLPPTLTEQKAIANALSDMDSEIHALEDKRDKYKQIKQGMMQELLTGKIRLV